MELYIHIPFCVKKCDYCDFVSFPTGNKSLCNYKSQEDIGHYIEVLERELESIQQLPLFGGFETVFIGGGTPSVLSVEQMERILSRVMPLLKDKNGQTSGNACCEFTVECNPGTLTSEKLELYRRYGVNRLSLGLQSTQNRHLKELGRIHSYEQFLESFRLAREAGFDNINVDLMSAIPGQTVEEWSAALRTVAELGPEHISAYSLIIEEGTPFYERYAEKTEERPCSGRNAEKTEELKLPPLPDEDTEREMYHITEEILKEYGYHRYEISNYAREGYECRHNLGYWTGEEYLGIGLNAASYLNAGTIERIKECDAAADTPGWTGVMEFIGENKISPKNYIRFSEATDFDGFCLKKKLFDAACVSEILEKEDRMAEFCILSLRLTKGIDTDKFSECFGCGFYEKYGNITEKYINNGLLEKNGNSVRLTRDGFDLSNVVMAEFL